MSRFQKKPSNSNKDRNANLIIYTNKYEENIKKIYHDDHFIIVSIDPAVKNYCIRIEKRPRPNYTGKISTILFQNIDLNPDKFYQENNNYCKIYTYLIELLDSVEEHFIDVDYVLIEKQLPENIISTRIAQHTITYFLLKLKNSLFKPIIAEVDPRLKTKLPGIPSGLNKSSYKIHTRKKVEELLKLRNDEVSLKIISNSRKKDDLADTVAQIEIVAIKMGWPTTEDLTYIV